MYDLDFDELDTPLRRRTWRERMASISISPLKTTVYLTFIGLGGLVAWSALIGAERAIEPVKTVALPPAPKATAEGVVARKKITVLNDDEPLEPKQVATEHYSAPPPLVRVGSPFEGKSNTPTRGKWIRIPRPGEVGLSAIDRQFGDEEDDITTGTVSPRD
ncbi:MAG: hypothetical protein ACR2OJ_11985 [Hyphomicrobiales bacterium]